MSARRRWALAAAVTALAAAGLWTAYRKDLKAAEGRLIGRSQMAPGPSGPIEYAVAGEGAPVLMIHGAGGGFDQALDIGQAEAGRFKVIAPSRFGYLRSSLPADASPEAQADAFAALLDHLRIEQVTAIGASAGAPSALQFALRHPDRCRSLVLLVPAAYSPDRRTGHEGRWAALTDRLIDAATRSDLLFWLSRKLAPGLMTRLILATDSRVIAALGEDERARAKLILDHVAPIGPRAAGLANDARVVRGLKRYDLEKIAMPVLAISLEDDLYGTYPAAAYTARSVPDGRFVGYPTGGHIWAGRHAEVSR